MTGPDHYREAERYLGVLVEKERGEYPGEESIVAEAQVHAILALAAATALGTSAAEALTWAEVAGTRPSDGGTEPGPRR